MSATLLLFFFILALLTLLAFKRPAYGVSLYLLLFFAHPGYWWWGSPLSFQRWSLLGGIVLLATVVFSGRDLFQISGHPATRRIQLSALALTVNATFVHLVLADDWNISAGPYWQLLKFVLLFFLIVSAAKTKYDLRIIVLSMLIGAAYIGYECTINDRGGIVHGRLEGIGAPGAKGANQLASLMVTLLPLSGAFFLAGKWWEKLLMLPIAPFMVNVVLLCNSRGAFLAAIASVVILLALAPRDVRLKAMRLAGLGALAVWMLLGDPRILDRFWTTFADKDERDASAAGRLEYWKAGLRMIKDYPLGAGGNGFKRAHGPRYIAAVVGDEFEARSVHNGYINQVCEWGIQGLVFSLSFLLGGFMLAWRIARGLDGPTDLFSRLLGILLVSGLAAFLITAVFGDYIDAEWGYWMCALAVAAASLNRAEHAAEPAEPVAEQIEPSPILPVQSRTVESGTH